MKFIQFVSDAIKWSSPLARGSLSKKGGEEFYFFLTSNTISRTMMIIASTATTSRYVITLLRVDAKLDVLRPLTDV